MTVPRGTDAATPAERQRAAIRSARERMAAFVVSTADGVEAAARAAESALHGALSTGASIERVSAELELSPRALRSIVEGRVCLRALHPDARVRTT